jgi:hypothetical protein
MLSIYFIPPSGKIHTILESCFISPLFSNLDAAHKTLPSGNYNTGYEIFSDLNGKIDVLIASVSR